MGRLLDLAIAPRANRSNGVKDVYVELRALVDAFAAFHGFTPEQTADAHEITQSDPRAAFDWFRKRALKNASSESASPGRKDSQE